MTIWLAAQDQNAENGNNVCVELYRTYLHEAGDLFEAKSQSELQRAMAKAAKIFDATIAYHLRIKQDGAVISDVNDWNHYIGQNKLPEKYRKDPEKVR